MFSLIFNWYPPFFPSPSYAPCGTTHPCFPLLQTPDKPLGAIILSFPGPDQHLELIFAHQHQSFQPLWLFETSPVCRYLSGTSRGRSLAAQVCSQSSHIPPSAPFPVWELCLLCVVLGCRLSFHTGAEGCVPVQGPSPPVHPWGAGSVGPATLFTNGEATALPPSVYSPR